MNYTCKLCKQVQKTFVTDTKDEICLTCYFKNTKETKEDMNKVEEYIQGDHSHHLPEYY